MSLFSAVQHNVFRPLERVGDWFLPTLARFIFLVTLFVYFFNSATLKLGGDGINALFAPTAGMFGQMLPAAADAAGYDVSQATLFQSAVMLSGTWAEFLLPCVDCYWFVYTLCSDRNGRVSCRNVLRGSLWSRRNQ